VASARAEVVSSFTVVNGARSAGIYAIFEKWDLALPQKRNLDLVRQRDPLGLGSASRCRDLAATLNRQFDIEQRDRLLVELAQAGTPLDTWRPLLLWHLTRDEFIVRDFLLNWLFPLHASGTWRIRTNDVLPYLAQLHGRADIRIPLCQHA